MKLENYLNSLVFRMVFLNLMTFAIIGTLSYSLGVGTPPARQMTILGLGFGVYFIISTIIPALLAHRLMNSLRTIALALSTKSDLFFTLATHISKASTDLSDATAEQSSALQDTAASIGQVSAMVSKSADSATLSQQTSQGSRQAAENGHKAVEDTIDAISEISKSNSSIIQQIEQGNKQIADIVKVIAEIGDKTKVINDIVFQTKLLSFNASVEAARAGEHGKGFAVVAEEVGNLAQMSGNAAKEITDMLNGSIQKVEGIVTSTKSQVDRLVSENKEKISTGNKVATLCGKALKEILAAVQSVDGLVNEISSASREQAQGVSEINRAISKLNDVTQRNTTVAQETSKSSRQLNLDAEGLKSSLGEMLGLLNAAGTHHSTPPIPSEPPSRMSTQLSTTPKATTAPTTRQKVPSKTLPPVPSAPALPKNVPLLPSKDDPRFIDA